MLRLNLKKLCLAKGIKTPHSYLTKRGFTPQMATKLLRGNVKNVKTELLEGLCYHLNCLPNDLWEWLPDRRYKDLPDHPLQEIKARNEDIDVGKLLRYLSKDQLREVSTQIQKTIGLVK